MQYFAGLLYEGREIRAVGYHRIPAPVNRHGELIPGQILSFPQAQSNWGPVSHFVLFNRYKGGTPKGPPTLIKPGPQYVLKEDILRVRTV